MRSQMKTALQVAAGCVMAVLFSAGSASALPAGWTCLGNCSVAPSGADGDVTLAPGGVQFDWVSDDGGISLAGAGGPDLNLGQETDGSIARSVVFAADAGDLLEFDFNYITTDGTLSFIEYGWARLLDAALNPVALLFTARTTPLANGNAVPGPNMPAIDPNVTLTPPSIPMQPAPSGGGPNFSPLGGDSGACFTGVVANGCGLTGWIHSAYVVQAGGNYILEFGVTNWGDTAFDSAFAFAGTQIDGTPIGGVPEPASLLLLGTGMALVARRVQSRRRRA
jgi:hypothetical protein